MFLPLPVTCCTFALCCYPVLVVIISWLQLVPGISISTKQFDLALPCKLFKIIAKNSICSAVQPAFLIVSLGIISGTV